MMKVRKRGQPSAKRPGGVRKPSATGPSVPRKPGTAQQVVDEGGPSMEKVAVNQSSRRRAAMLDPAKAAVPAVQPANPSQAQAGADGPGAEEAHLGSQEPSSRLCIKNLPKYVSEAKLKEHFGAKGEVTDVKVLRTRDGISRQLAFVGFRSVEDATSAKNYFDRTFLDASRISVEFARKYKDPSLARPWSKHSEGSSAHAKAVAAAAGAAAGAVPKDSKKKKGGSKKVAPASVSGSAAEVAALVRKLRARVISSAAGANGKGSVLTEGDDEKLAEFLSLMAPRSRAKLWGNDEVAPAQTMDDLMAQLRGMGEEENGKDDEASSEGGDEEDEYQDLDLKAATLGDDDEADEEEQDDDDDDDDEGGVPVTLRNKDEAVVNEGLSDLEYLRARMRKWDDGDDEPAAAAAQDSKQGPGASWGVPEGKEGVSDEDDSDTPMLDAAARGDQSGVGPSHTSDQAAGKGARGAKKAAGQRKGGQSPEPDGTGPAGGAGAPGSEAGGAADHGEVAAAQAGGDTAGRGAAAAGHTQHHSQDVKPDPEAAIRDTGRLFVRNLPYTATEADLTQLFGVHGDVSSVHLVLDRETKKSKGLAYVLYLLPEDAVKAYRELDGQIFQGRLLHVLPAERPRGDTADQGVVEEVAGAEGDGAHHNKEGSSYKAELAQKRKADAGNRAAWNSLFMRPDTVAEAVAAHYGVSKSELMDARSSGDVAVRVALGEAAVIAATKAALADAGVDVGALESAAAAGGSAAAKGAAKAVARSSTILLAKNLPYTVTEEELVELFGRCGPIARLVLPPSHTLALVEFTEPQDARMAFKSLAYKKVQHVPLYLEWAPRDIFSSPAPERPLSQPNGSKAAGSRNAGQAAAAGTAKAKSIKAAPVAPAKSEAAAGGGGEGEEGEGEGATIYVKNLAFATTDAALKKHFDKVISSLGGRLLSARVARRKAPPAKGKSKGKEEALSAGFGFAEVDSRDVAQAAIQQLQLSKRKPETSKPTATAATTAQPGAKDAGAAAAADAVALTKLVVRNVAFEATRKDLVGLFTPFGHLKSCRLPKKFDGSHRGFAFIEFTTKQEAKSALEGVTGTHLYGRRLVVEYAKDEEGLDELRAKTAKKFRGGDAEVEEELFGAGSAAAGGGGRAAKRLRKSL